MITEEDTVHKFKYKNLTYGWYQKELYRLPYNKDMRYYELKKLKRSKDSRYKLGGCKKSIKQLKYLTLHELPKTNLPSTTA